MFLLTCVYRLVFTVTNRLREEVVKINNATGMKSYIDREIMNLILVGVKLFYGN